MPMFPIFLFPVLGFVINGLFGGRFSKQLVAFIGVGSAFLSLVWMIFLGIQFLSVEPQSRVWVETLFTWMQVGFFKVDFSFKLDALSMVMIFVVTFVGFFIHLYSVGYMYEDEGFSRYFAYLNLFMFAMLVLVLGNNFLVLFIGWEGVGFCSYILIGFWYLDHVNADAGKKAFIVNRIGDLGFLIGLFCIVYVFNTLDFDNVFKNAPDLLKNSKYLVHLIPFFLLLGATGKSAQVPLYVWLPDAMQGPTPVSALIHAATMVTAGVYMISRAHVLYLLSPLSLVVVASIGIITLLLSASIALVQNDIKRVLAYSTISQLGYMFVALGCKAFSYGIFHLFTHAFFKACLFLGAGVVMHALHGELDVQKMGGLKKKMPLTYWTFLIASLALCGIMPFSGFFSKDAILSVMYGEYGFGFWLLGAIGASMTAFYMFRVIFLAFHGSPRMGMKVYERIHDASSSMAIALVVLATGAFFVGFLEVPFFEQYTFFSGFLSHVITTPHHAISKPLEAGLMVGSISLALMAIAIAYIFYLRLPGLPYFMGEVFTRAYRTLWYKYWVDEIYQRLIVKPIVGLSNFLWKVVDVLIIDGFANGLAKVAFVGAGRIRLIQSGNVQVYALTIFVGIFCILMYVIFVF